MLFAPNGGFSSRVELYQINAFNSVQSGYALELLSIGSAVSGWDIIWVVYDRVCIKIGSNHWVIPPINKTAQK
ncbi:MAG: hypothetical protein ACI808_001894 [Paraglaciecola sp.]